MRPSFTQIKTALAAAFGAAVFWLLGLPLPFLLGPMTICLALALAGQSLEGMGQIGMAFRTILGVAIGASITPEVLSALPQMAASLALLPLFLLTVAATSYPLMRRVFGFDPTTSYYAAMPGGLQDLLIFGEEAGANLRVLSLIHATRVLCIVSIAPLILNAIWAVDLVAPPGRPAADLPPLQIALLISAGLIGWRIALRLNIMGASILGPMVLTTLLSVSGIITQRPPAEMIWASQLFIGIAVGSRYVGLTLREMRTIVFAGIVNAMLLALLSGIFILLIVQSHLAASDMDAYLAFLPGGQSEMVVLAIIAGADLTYVVLHHILRIALIVTCAPLVLKWLQPSH
ncbi:AbrB family transcriptional regulator [Cognatishimia sp. SS12]|uniref:AbrB family transcriptional regulator n=1 Tax=Cognatishimia sp. SS12 TaxID=2979465 RepID=UPI00232F47CA|nr:AbrB family transcriptional regulator [Cognatishimia sp. SS12]MDC0736875.1 AbrB family transcriptional regulator [Cognatishimia sp. SS12]